MPALDVVSITLNPAIDRTVTIPGFKAGETNRVESMQSHAGGKGINVAAVLADLGFRVGITGFLGRDNPVLFETLFGAKRIEDRLVRLPGNTRQCIKIADPGTQQITEVNFPGLQPRGDDIEFFHAMVEALDASWYVLAGSLPDGVHAGIYEELIARLRKKGRKVLLDTSGDALTKAVSAAPNIIKPNRDELAALAGRPLPHRNDVLEAVRPLLDQGVEQVVVSLGAEGALFITSQQTIEAIPPKINIRSTVGAGDAMAAGLIAAIERGMVLQDQARFATACAVNAIQQLGPGLTSSQDVENLCPQVMIH